LSQCTSSFAEHEIAERSRRRLERHLAKARLPPGKTLDTFDFEVVPVVSKAQVMALAAGDAWLNNGTNLLLFGPPGGRKSHLLAALGCSAAIWMGRRIASPENVPQTSSVASPPVFPLPHWSPPEPQLPFPILNQCLLMLALWSCGRRGSVVQAQRQIHRALCTAIPGTVVRAIAEPVQLAALMRKARIGRSGSEYHLVGGSSAPFLQTALQSSQLSVRVDTGALSLQPLQ
jgi:hypothetical protein